MKGTRGKKGIRDKRGEGGIRIGEKMEEEGRKREGERRGGGWVEKGEEGRKKRERGI